MPSPQTAYARSGFDKKRLTEFSCKSGVTSPIRFRPSRCSGLVKHFSSPFIAMQFKPTLSLHYLGLSAPNADSVIPHLNPRVWYAMLQGEPRPARWGSSVASITRMRSPIFPQRSIPGYSATAFPSRRASRIDPGPSVGIECFARAKRHRLVAPDCGRGPASPFVPRGEQCLVASAMMAIGVLRRSSVNLQWRGSPHFVYRGSHAHTLA